MASDTAAAFTRKLGRSDIEVSAMGLGCWAIGGPMTFDGVPAGWGQVDDAESIRALHRSLDLGISLFDTADVYGCGHSERLLGRALADRRDRVVIATRVALLFDEQLRRAGGANVSPEYIRGPCEASLHRLGTDYIDLYQLHGALGAGGTAEDVVAVMEELVAAGKIRWYEASTDDPAVARIFAQGPHCAAMQQELNIFHGNDETLALCETFGQASINRTPLAMGLLTGKYQLDGKPSGDDVRLVTPHWDYFKDGAMEHWLAQLDAIRAVLTRGGRTLAQGTLGWIWARSPVTIPIPGFKTVAQVEENAGALQFGPLRPEQMAEIERLLGRAATV